MFEEILMVHKKKILKEINNGELHTLKCIKNQYPELHWMQLRCEKTGDTLLHIACKIGALNAVQYLLENVDPVITEPRNFIGKTPLHDCAHQSHYKIVDYLLNYKVDIDALKRADWTPLMLACTKISSDAEETIRTLLSNGANVNCQNKDGWTALHLVAREGNVKILDLLISYNVDIYKLTKNNRSALHIACLHGNVEMVKKLMNYQFDKEAKDSCGNTALHDAVISSNFEIIHILHNCGFNINATNNTGLNVLHLSASKCPDEVVEYVIVNLKPKLDLQSDMGFTAAHFAAKSKRISTFDLLKKYGANVDIEDSFGRKAIDYFSL